MCTQHLNYLHHYENLPMQYIDVKMENFSGKKRIHCIFNFHTQNIDCGYTFELPQRGGLNEYPQSFWIKKKKYKFTPVNQFYYIKVGYEGVYFSRTSFPDVLWIDLHVHS